MMSRNTRLQVINYGALMGALMVVSPCWFATVARAESDRCYLKTAKGEKAQPIVAVDNVCAWPNNLTMLRDGTIVAVIYNRPCHGWMVGDAECWASEDRGRTWQKRGTPAPHEPNTVRMFAAAGLAANGELIVICSGFSNDYPPGKSGRPFRAGILDPWVSRSRDGGRTWTIDKQTFPREAPDGGKLFPFGNIVTGDDGTMHAAIYSTRNPVASQDEQKFRLYLYRSPDNGKTWGEPVAMDQDSPLNETATLHLGDGRWLAAARSGVHDGLQLYSSSDDAKTWQYRKRLTGALKHPGHLLRLRDGRLLLSYGNRTKNDWSVEVRCSDDEGKTWSKPIRVVDVQHRDSGHPSSVQLPDGQVVTAYYAPSIQYHVSYCMGVVIWDPEMSLKRKH